MSQNPNTAPLPTALVEEWRKASEGATPGPWTMRPVKGYRMDYVFSEHPSVAPTPKNPNRHMVADCDCGNDSSDARWIARCSPSGISTLLDALEASTREVAELRASNELLAKRLAFALDEGTSWAVKAGGFARERDEAMAALTCVKQQCETAVYNIVQREHDEAVARSFQSIADYCARVLATPTASVPAREQEGR